jgi:enoyl-CoA hydratase/carnithine racemase
VVRALWTKVYRFKKPVIAASTARSGGGCELALAVNFRYIAANDNSKLGAPSLIWHHSRMGRHSELTRLHGMSKRWSSCSSASA